MSRDLVHCCEVMEVVVACILNTFAAARGSVCLLALTFRQLGFVACVMACDKCMGKSTQQSLGCACASFCTEGSVRDGAGAYNGQLPLNLKLAKNPSVR